MVCPYDLGIHGGVQDQVLRLAQWLGDAGHYVKVIGPGQAEIPEFVSVGAATIVPANGAATPVALRPGVGRRVVDELETVDVAHLHEPLMPMVSLTAMRRSMTPLVGTFHADPSRLGRAVYRLGKPLLRRWVRRLAVVTAVSPVAAREPAALSDVRLIPNAVDLDRFTPGDKQPDLVMFLGRDDPRKGLDVLLQAWPEVRQANPAARLVVAGVARSDDPGLGIEYRGPVGEEEKLSLLEVAGILCTPNLGGESFGMVLVEGLAGGCAVVASALPAFVHVGGDAARYVAPGDAAGLAGVLIELLGRPATIAAMGRAGRERAMRYGRERALDAYVAAYQDAVSARSG